MTKKNKLKGMTLVELTVVIFLIGMTSTFYMVSMNFTNRVKLEKKAQEIVSAIEYAKQTALLTGLLHTLQLNGQSLYVIQPGSLNDTLLAKVTLDKNQVLSCNVGAKLTINSNGAVSQAATFTLKCRNLDQQIRITIGVATSKVRVYRESPT